MTAPTWDLDALLPGGVHGAPFTDAIVSFEAQAEDLVRRADALPEPPLGAAERVALTNAIHEALRAASPVRVVSGGEAAAHTNDRVAASNAARVSAMTGRLQRALVPIEDQIARCDDAHFAAMCALPEAEPLVAWMRSLRRRLPLRLPRPEEALLAELGRDGIHAWSRHYDRIAGRLQVDLPTGERVSMARAKNLYASADAAVRESAHEAVEAAWAGVAEDCAAALTHIVGTRETLIRRRGLDPVDDSLAMHRMQRTTLDAMLEGARRAGPVLERYLGIKARLLGKPRLGWSDLGAPLGASGAMRWDEATDFVLTHFGAWHPDLRGLAERAFSERWVEAEDRDHKRPGAYCASLGDGRSRVYMTFGGNRRSVTTLAHELGHAWHNHVLGDVPFARRKVTSTLAESASVLAENLVRDAALAAATTPAERLAMLDERLAAGVSFLMNLPFRYDLERDLYTLRARGELDPAALCEASVTRQREHHRDQLVSWSPYFWADKLHFYISHFAFYNYPYVFGYLFSALLYARSKAEGRSFHPRVVEVLRRSGWDDAEPLARDLLGIDLGDPDVWSEGWAPLISDLNELQALVGGS